MMQFLNRCVTKLVNRKQKLFYTIPKIYRFDLAPQLILFISLFQGLHWGNGGLTFYQGLPRPQACVLLGGVICLQASQVAAIGRAGPVPRKLSCSSWLSYSMVSVSSF